MKHVTIRLKEEDHEFLRRYSFENRKSMNKVIVELIKKLREENEKEGSAPTAK